MTKLTSDTDLVDLMLYTVEDDSFHTYDKGEDRIDYALVDRWVAKALETMLVINLSPIASKAIIALWY